MSVSAPSKLNNPIETKKIELITLSPVFIGSGESRLPKNSEHQEDTLLEEIINKGLENEWNNYFITYSGDDKPTVEKFLKDRCPQFPLTQTGNRNDFITTTKKVFIPGSSIKGAIRTAVLSEVIVRTLGQRQLTQKEYEAPEELLNVLQVSVKEKDKTLKDMMRCVQVSDSELVDNSKIKLYMAKHRSILNSSIVKELARAKKQFILADTRPSFSISIDQTIACRIPDVYQDIFTSIDNLLGIVEKHYQLLLSETESNLGYESTQPNKQQTQMAEEEKKLKRQQIEDAALMKKFGRVNNIPNDRLLPVINDVKSKYPHLYNNSLINNASINSAIKVYDNRIGLNPNINIGGQSGFNSKVVLRALAKGNQERYLQKKKQELNGKFGGHNHLNPAISKAPRYIKTAGGYTIGWCHLRVAQESKPHT